MSAPMTGDDEIQTALLEELVDAAQRFAFERTPVARAHVNTTCTFILAEFDHLRAQLALATAVCDAAATNNAFGNSTTRTRDALTAALDAWRAGRTEETP